MSLPLEGIKVIDWTVWMAGPSASALLGSLGADVVKIEDMHSGDPGRGTKRMGGMPAELPTGSSVSWEFYNRDKRDIALDLKTQGGKEIVYRLVKEADVFVQNYRQGVAQRLGLDYERLRQINPRLVYASVTGFGPKGPLSKEPALDPMGNAFSGFMMGSTDPGQSLVRIASGVADTTTGLTLAFGILTALRARDRFGVGQEIAVSLLGSMMWAQALSIMPALLLGKPAPKRPRTQAANPLHNHYLCADGRWIMLGNLQSDRYWPTFCRAVGLPQLEKDPRFHDSASREAHCEDLVKLLDDVFDTRTCQEWIGILKGSGDLLCCPVHDYASLVEDAQVIASEYVVEQDHPVLGHIRTLGLPIHFSETPGKLRRPAQQIGEATEEVLLELGYSWEDISRLREAGAI